MMGIDEATGKDRQATLYKLTRQTSLPTMFHNDERSRNVWIEQLALAEQIGAPGSPQLIPSDCEQRVEVFGLCAVVLAEDGFIWNMRLLGDSPLARERDYMLIRDPGQRFSATTVSVARRTQSIAESNTIGSNRLRRVAMVHVVVRS